MWLRIIVVLTAVIQSGCANFKAVSEFGAQTTTMTSAVKDEFTQLESQCLQQASLVAAINNSQDDGPFKDCDRYKQAQGELASVTVSVLDGYANALTGLANGKTFDLSPVIKGVSGKLQGLKDSSGNALIDAKELGAITKVVDLLVDIWTSAKREEAVRRLVAESPNLAITGNVLKSFFVEVPDAPVGRAKAPYTNLVAIASNSMESTEIGLTAAPMRTAEPIRTYELLRDLKVRKDLLTKRGATFGSGPGLTARANEPAKPLVQARIASAIDAWLKALEKFSTDALKPDPTELYERLKDFREKAIAARDAISN